MDCHALVWHGVCNPLSGSVHPAEETPGPGDGLPDTGEPDMTWISGPMNPDVHLVTVAELLQAQPPLCCNGGPAWSKCCREDGHAQPCAALGTDGVGTPVVVTWYRPSTDAWPLTGRTAQEPGA
jgi:hypothetical protein